MRFVRRIMCSFALLYELHVKHLCIIYQKKGPHLADTMGVFHWKSLIGNFYFRLQKSKLMQKVEWNTNN